MSRRRRDKKKMKAATPPAAPKPAAGKVSAPIKSATLSPLLVLLSAPSGGGKTTVCRELLAARPDMARAITCTTRAPRTGEKDGVDYYFLDAASFLKRVQAGNFLEHATVYGNSYGTLKSEVLNKLRQGRVGIGDLRVGQATSRWERLERPQVCERERRRVGIGTGRPVYRDARERPDVLIRAGVGVGRQGAAARGDLHHARRAGQRPIIHDQL